MANLQEVFNRIQETKRRQREIKSMYREALGNSKEHKELSEQLKNSREKKKKIEEAYRADFTKEFEELDRLKLELESDNMLLSDLAVNQIMKGESIEIADKDQNQYEPIFTVRFKKTGIIRPEAGERPEGKPSAGKSDDDFFERF